MEARDDERVFVEVADFRGACVRVLVDGVEADLIAWQPYEVEIADLLAGKTEVELTVEVLSHRRNAFGPLRHVEKWPEWTGPAQFATTGDQWQEEYCGCLSVPKLSYRKMG